MKRLLAYLFIVVGFGLTFNVNAKAKVVFCELLIKDDGGKILKAGQRGTYGATYNVEPVYLAKDKCYFINDGGGRKIYHPQISLENYVDQVLYYRVSVGKSSVSNYFNVALNVGKSLIKEFEKNKIDLSYLISELENRYRVSKKDLGVIKQTQIAKKEPSQTKNSSQYVDPRDYVFCAGGYYGSGIIEKNKAANNSWYKDCKATIEEFVFVHLYERIKNPSTSNKETTLINDLNNLYALFKQYPFDQNIINKVIISEPKLSIFKKIAGINSNIINNDIANLEQEKKKIEEEKKKIEEEKRKIAEAKKKQEEEEKQRKEANAKLYIIGSGTGFFVSAEGHIVSNDHVVGICRKVASKIDGEIKYFNVIKTDEVNDLGIVKGEYKNPTYLSIKTDGAEYGEDIVAFGYPLEDELSTSVKLTRGIVSSLSGPGNNYSEIQIDAAIQPGNSGGPILNMEGQVVGVASSGLNKLYMLEKSEYIPENVNFAVAAPTLSNFLKANGVKVDTKKFEVNNTKELARIGRPATLQLFCMNTQAVFEELKKTKKHSDVLFEKVIDLR